LSRRELDEEPPVILPLLLAQNKVAEAVDHRLLVAPASLEGFGGRTVSQGIAQQLSEEELAIVETPHACKWQEKSQHLKIKLQTKGNKEFRH